MFGWLQRRAKAATPPHDPGTAQSTAATATTTATTAAIAATATATATAATARTPPRPATPADSDAAQAYSTQAQAALAKRDLTQALALLRKAVAADASHADAQANLGAVLRDLGQAADAARHLETALALQPRHAQAAFNLGLLRLDARRWQEAADLLETAAKGMPGNAETLYWLGNARMGMGDAAAARKAYDSATRQPGSHVQARWGLAMAQLPAIAASADEQARAPDAFAREMDKAAAWIRKQHPGDGWRAVGAQQPYYLAYIEGNHGQVLARYGAACAGLMATRQAAAPQAGGKGKLRIGIVSAHVHSHSVWHALVRGWVQHLDPAQFEIELFHTGSTRDAETEWAARRVRRLHHGLGAWPDWAQAIHQGRFDVLVHPEIGMDATAMRLASLRLAQHQCAAWGHPITTGLPTIDTYVSAQAFEPADGASHYTERLLALPRLGCAYQPHSPAPQPVDLGAWGVEAHEHVIVCPGVPFKYMPAHDAMLVEVARRCAPCKLLFFGDAQAWMTQALHTRLRATFTAASVDYDRCVRVLPWLAPAQFHGLMARADVVLDTAGFSGFNTAMQALQAGAALLAWEGSAMRGRFASGILRQAGMAEWIAHTHGGVAERAQRLCKDAATRERVKAQARAALPALCNDKAAVDAFAAFLRAPG